MFTSNWWLFDFTMLLQMHFHMVIRSAYLIIIIIIALFNFRWKRSFSEEFNEPKLLKESTCTLYLWFSIDFHQFIISFIPWHICDKFAGAVVHELFEHADDIRSSWRNCEKHSIYERRKPIGIRIEGAISYRFSQILHLCFPSSFKWTLKMWLRMQFLDDICLLQMSHSNRSFEWPARWRRAWELSWYPEW